jgi:hypothetical protein
MSTLGAWALTAASVVMPAAAATWNANRALAARATPEDPEEFVRTGEAAGAAAGLVASLPLTIYTAASVLSHSGMRTASGLAMAAAIISMPPLVGRWIGGVVGGVQGIDRSNVEKGNRSYEWDATQR